MPRHAIHLGTAWNPPDHGSPAWRRWFGRPAGIEPGNRLLLVCTGVRASDPWRHTALNGMPLVWRATGEATLECDVTGMLIARNELVVSGGDTSALVATPIGARADLPEAWGRLSLVVVSD